MLDDAAARTRSIVEAHELTDVSALTGRFRDEASAPQLQWILLHLVQEYARHLGHLDIARELIDGQTGEDGLSLSPRWSTLIVRFAMCFSPSAFGWTTTGLVPWSTGSIQRTPGRLAGVVALGDLREADVRRAGGRGRAAYGVVEGGLDAAEVGHVALRHRHLVEAAVGPGQDPRVAEDRDPRVRRPASPPGAPSQRRVGRVPDVVAKDGCRTWSRHGLPWPSVESPADAALDDGADEGVVVVAADGHRHQLRALAQGVELGRDAGVLTAAKSLVSAAPQVTSVSRAPVLRGDHVRVVAVDRAHSGLLGSGGSTPDAAL